VKPFEVVAALTAILTWTGASNAHEEAGADPVPAGPFYLNVALAPMINQQQIEGPNRDDLLVNDYGIANSLNFAYAVLPWLEPGVFLQFDAGNTRHAKFSRPDEQTGETQATEEVDGAFFEFWTMLFVRGRYGPLFGELGWAPLILRKDSTRTDLPNVRGETDGLFVGSRAVAWMLAFGGAIPVADDLDVTLRVQYRIRYLVSRGGEDLAGDEELGNMHLSPSAGLGYRF
jgi:hypothetical protein